MYKIILAISLAAAMSNASAELPTIGGIKLGAQIGKDIPLCDVASQTPKLDAAVENAQPCANKLPEYSILAGRDRYQIRNAKTTAFGKINTVDTYAGLVWKVSMELSNKYDSRITNAQVYVDVISNIVDQKARKHSDGYINTYACGTRGHPKTCWSSLRKYWFAEDVEYTLEFERPDAIGSFTVEARFGKPNEKVATYEPLIK